MRQHLSWLARLTAVVSCILVLGPAPMASAQSKQVWAFYMGFWNGESSWDAQSQVLDDYPTAGKYDARDKGTARSQIDQAKGAGIDAFVVAWRGSHDSAATDALKNVLKQAKGQDFKVGAVLDQYDGADQGQTTASLHYLMDEIIDQPAYLHYRGKPVIMFAFQKAFNWSAIRSQVDPDRRTLWIAEGLKGGNLYGGAMDGMYAFNLAWADGRSNIYARDRDAVAANGGSVYLPTFHPGWDEDKIARVKGRGNPTSRRDRANGDFLRSTWNGAVSAGTEVVLGVSWNEFIENSHLEPSNRYGTQALDTLRPLISAWKGGGGQPSPGGSVDLLLAEADARQLIQFNPGASLQKRIFADGFVPNSGEFDVSASGRNWRGQRAEHLRSGQVRVYYTELDRWNEVRVAQRGAVNGDPIGRALLDEGQRRQLIQFNPGAALQKRIFADGFVPNSPEFSSDSPGRRYAVQRTEHLGNGEVRVYHAPASNFADVRFLRGTPGTRPGSTEVPQPSPTTPSDEPMYIVQAWDAEGGEWVDGKLTLPEDDVCTRIRWRTANIDAVYLQHEGYDDFPGVPEVGEGEITGCIESSDRGEQRWNLNVRLRNGDWVDDSIRLRGD